MLIYTGIGSRVTPDNVQLTMTTIASQLAKKWRLRSGRASIADYAFETGAIDAAIKNNTRPNTEIFVPWAGHNGDFKEDIPFITQGMKLSDPIVPLPSEELIRIASYFHPNWEKASPAAKFVSMRNVCLVAGIDLNTASNMVICWTPRGRRDGGAGEVLKIAEYLKIPIFNLAIPLDHPRLFKYVAAQEQTALASASGAA